MSNSQKVAHITRLAQMQRKQMASAANITGKNLPCHVVAVNGAIVTVQFDVMAEGVNLPQVTIPCAGFEYIRYPIQKGDRGVAVAGVVSLKGVSGLGVGIPDLSLAPSLTALFFVPLSHVDWSKVDPDMLTLYGPGGVVVRTQDGSTLVTVKPGEVTVKADTIRLEGNIILAGPVSQEATEGGSSAASLIGPLDVKEGATVKGIQVETHTHPVNGVETGGGSVESEGPQ